MSPQPLVSVVINNYNYERFLADAIDSGLRQTYPNIEVVVVDDGSNDGSADVIRRFERHPRFTSVLKENGGQASAYNAGLDAASGDVIIFLDADDYLYPNAAAEIVKVWQPGVAKVQWRLDIVDGARKPTGEHWPNLPMVSSSECKRLLRLYGYYPAPPSSGNAYARSALEKFFPVPVEWTRGSDGYTIALAALYGDVVSINASLGAYRSHGDNMSEVSGVDVRKLHYNMLNEIKREKAIMEHAARLGDPIDHPLVGNIPAHWKYRLLSYKLDPDNHPIDTDRIVRLVLRGIRAAWRYPHISLKKRLLTTAAFPVFGALPPPVLHRIVNLLFLSHPGIGASAARRSGGL